MAMEIFHVTFGAAIWLVILCGISLDSSGKDRNVLLKRLVVVMVHRVNISTMITEDDCQLLTLYRYSSYR